MFSHPERLIIALMIALLFAGVTLVAAEASFQGRDPPCQTAPVPTRCKSEYHDGFRYLLQPGHEPADQRRLGVVE